MSMGGMMTNELRSAKQMGLRPHVILVDNAGDIIFEAINEGYDTVQSSVSYTLGNSLNDLTLTGADNITGAGNALDNYLTGNDGNNLLSGGAGNGMRKRWRTRAANNAEGRMVA